MPIPKIPKLIIIQRDVCKKLGYEWKLIDSYSKNLVEISDGKKSFFSSNSKIGFYPLNTKFSSQLVQDKAWVYKILKQKGFKIPKGNYFFLQDNYRESRGDGQEIQDAFDFAKQIGFPIFVKPNNGSSGNLAEIIYNQTELKSHLNKISKDSGIAIIQENIEMSEYRLFVLNNKIQFAYQRVSPQIEGDGKQTVEQLIVGFHKKISKKGNCEQINSPFFKKILIENKLKINSVLKKGQKLKIISKTNISAGGAIQNYTEKFSKETIEWVKKITKIFNIDICGIDIFSKKGLSNPNDFVVIEINHNPSLLGIYEYGKKETVAKIWKNILNKYFRRK